ncbi:DUF177 domain-containing protein [Corynebacterium testudinoris]|uniref:Putative metal-binding protein, possibly nucleic-acid binding n=1 Tax=Corynebacterium testudinoris TaxID=136857 RepID=A0A0G3H8U5_9CORY|nr:YceD family protein [Corynebacterium testudinoris]AKK09150.1 putative metal-binding protein, possibly nucleic-acid binding [Corynebacterium testudinoris]MBX8996493.1 DUF177 domain-containing protein [Corynebacterium testudinoris]
MTSPFKFNIARLSDFEQRTQTGPAPVRIGPEMIGIPEGGEVTVDATLTHLGGGVLVDADVRGELIGQCVRCLTEIRRPLDMHISQVFSTSPDFVTGDEDEDGLTDDIPEVTGDTLDLLQTVIDEAGLTLPFNPTCDGGCSDEETPAPDGVSGEDEDKLQDPRWAGLEKFL